MSLVYYSTNNDCTNVLLIDSNIKDFLTVVNSCNSNTLPIVYSYSSTKEDLLHILSTFTTISRIGFFTDSITKTFIENDPFFLNTDTSSNYSTNVSFIISIINQYNVSYIDFLACNSLNDKNWVNYYNILMSLTNVNVGASNNNSGNIQYGGDWITESNSQNIEYIYFTQEIQYYKYLLGNNFFNTLMDITTNFSSIPKLTSLPTFNGTNNFSSGFIINANGSSADLSQLYALNSIPTSSINVTNMYSYYNDTKYDISSFFVPMSTTITGTNTSSTTLSNTTYSLGTITTSSLQTISSGLSSTNYPNSVYWISNASSSITSSLVYTLFSYSFTYSGTTNTGKFYAKSTGAAYLYFNGTAPAIIGGTSSVLSSGPIALVNGNNYVQIVCCNSNSTTPSTNSCKVIASFFNNTNTFQIGTNNTWDCQPITASPITLGGLNTMFIYQGVYLATTNPISIYEPKFLYDQNSIRGTPNYYNYYIASCSTVSDFTSTNSITTLYTVDYGFRSLGFIKPTSSGVWNFYLTADDVAQIWIGVDSSGNPTTTVPSSSPQMQAILTSQTQYATNYSVTLNSQYYYPILIFFGQSQQGYFFQLDIYSPGNNPSNYYTNIVASSRTPHNSIFHYIDYNLQNPPATVLINGAIKSGFSSNGLITNTYYNSSGATSGTLYTFTSGTCNFKLTSGYTNCYLLSIGPGGSGGTSSASGGSGCFVSFGLIPNITYTITFVNGSGANGTSVAGKCTVVSNDSPVTINVTTPGGTITGTAAATQSGTVTPGTATTKFVGGTRGTGNGGNGFTIPTTINAIIPAAVPNFISLITAANGNNGFSGGGKAPSATLGGSGGNYNVGATTFSTNANGMSGVGYGAGGGGRASSGTTGGSGYPGVVFLYLAPQC